jgi:hypothetical protein
MTNLYWARYLFLFSLALGMLSFTAAFLVSLARSRGK